MIRFVVYGCHSDIWQRVIFAHSWMAKFETWHLYPCLFDHIRHGQISTRQIIVREGNQNEMWVMRNKNPWIDRTVNFFVTRSHFSYTSRGKDSLMSGEKNYNKTCYLAKGVQVWVSRGLFPSFRAFIGLAESTNYWLVSVIIVEFYLVNIYVLKDLWKTVWGNWLSGKLALNETNN